jgi:carboxypeptidase T
MYSRSTFSLLALLVLFFLSVDFGRADEKSQQIRIFVPDRSTLDRIWSVGIDYEGMTGKIGGWMEFVASEGQARELTSTGISYEVVVDDLAAFYESRLTPGPVNALGFGYGSMGGFYTFAEVLRQLDTMRLRYPGFISVRDSIGRTTDNRALWMVKITANADIDHHTRPQVLYTALTHAREPQGMMGLLYYMWWLLENYGSNPDATYLVNNRQMFFVPVLNPDGYVYNQTTNPNGGGNWRENRRFNSSSCYGVDLNRNFGPTYMWNANNNGSSTTPTCGSGTYRGPSPFSEPETQAIDNFMRTHNIKTCFNYHTYGNYLIYPFGYLSRENSDSLVYRDWAYDMIFSNHFTNGTDQQTVNYSTRGNSDDYMFGDTTKPITYAMTPEVGTSGFWPSTGEILPLAIQVLPQNKYLAYFAGHYPALRYYEIQDAGGNGFLDRGESFSLVTRWRNLGLNPAADLSISVSTTNPYVDFNQPTVQMSLASQTEAVISFSGTVSAIATLGVPFTVYLTETDAQGFLKTDTLRMYLGTPTVVFADSASNGIGNWSTGQGWGLTSSAHTPPSAFTDSPSGNYAASANNSLTLNSQLTLAGYNYAELRFWAKWAIEPTWDFATVEISTNNGSTWTSLRAPHSHFGSGRSGSQQPSTSWGYESYTPGLSWIEQRVDLSDYVERQIKLRFRMAADGGDQRDGFYVDDIRVLGYSTSVETTLVVTPGQYQFNGVTGRQFTGALHLYNFTNSSINIAIAETVGTTLVSGPNNLHDGSLNVRSMLERLRTAVRKSNIPLDYFARQSAEVKQPMVEPTMNPDVFTTIITDERDEVGFGAADVYRVQYQLRTVPLIGNYHDFRIVMADVPDTAVAGFISIDSDQDFGTGAFPTPFGLGPTSRDIGSEREVLFDASGLLFDSLGFGRIRAGVVFNTTNDSIVGLPFLLSITRDTVLTISTNGLGGIQESWIGAGIRKMNIGTVVARLNGNSFPDLAPAVGHGNIAGETGVSWLTEDVRNLTITSGDSAIVNLRALAATPPGMYHATIRVLPTGRAPINVPVTMTVTNPPPPVILASPTSFHDTLAEGQTDFLFLSIANNGGSVLTYGIVDSAGTPWLSISPTYGVLDSGQSTLTTLTFNATGLTPGSTYSSLIQVVSNDPAHSPVQVSVSLTVRSTTGVENVNGPPMVFALEQNYPNPFNPETVFRFQIPVSGYVTLKVYNVLGQEVATLVDGIRDAGPSEVTWDARSAPSGMYFYTLQSGTNRASRKLLILK